MGTALCSQTTMYSADDAFPGHGSLDTFRDVLNLQHPTQQLLEIIRAHPRDITILDLVVICLELVEESPSQIERLTSTLVDLKGSTEINPGTDVTVANTNR